MSEMSAEKKKEIELYIIGSYFGGGKNIEACVNGADLISGSGDIPDLLVEVETFNNELVTVRWDVKSESESVWKNEFMMVLSRERKIERNRCDSVDSMMYAWESWRAKIQGKPVFLKTNDEELQKDKRIEELERTVKALRAEKEVMERHIQELESRNVNLAETNTYLNNCKDSYLNMINTSAGYLKDWEEATGCSKPEQVKKKIYALENECRVWHDTADHQLEQIHGLEDDIAELYDANKELKSQIEEWKKATERCTPFLAGLRLGTLHNSYIRHNRLLFGEVRPEHMVCVGGDKKTIEQYLRDCNYNSAVDAINKLESEISEWRDATGGCLNPYYAKIKFEAYNNYIGTKLEKKD